MSFADSLSDSGGAASAADFDSQAKPQIPRLSLAHLSGLQEPVTLPLSEGLSAADFINIEAWMQRVLYDEKTGYYSAGVVDFDEREAAAASTGGVAKAKAPDFGTFASSIDSVLHLVLLDIAYRLYAARDPHEMGKPFLFVELSGGNGILAQQFLQALSTLSETQAGIWSALYTDMQYIIYEISPALAARQAERNVDFIASNHLTIKNVDACMVSERKPDFVFSNELLDVMPAQKLFLKDDGEWLVEHAVPFIEVLPDLGVEPRAEFLDYIAQYFTASRKPIRGIPLDRTTFMELKEHADFDLSTVAWRALHLPLAACPDVLDDVGGLLKVKAYQKSCTHVLSTNWFRLIESILACGPKMAALLDYGRYDALGTDPLMRTYKGSLMSRDYLSVGAERVDVTYNIDFHLLTKPFYGMPSRPVTVFQGALARLESILSLASKLRMKPDNVGVNLHKFIRAAFLSWTYVSASEAGAFPELKAGLAFDKAFSGPRGEEGAFARFYEPILERLEVLLAAQARKASGSALLFAERAESGGAVDVAKDKAAGAELG